MFRPAIALLTGTGCLLATTTHAQSLGVFRWQLQPFCNVVTVNVTQSGAVYTLDGYDDQCGAPTRAPLVGLATPNPDGTIGFGFHLVTTPAATPVAVRASVSLATVGGAWSDSAGNSGTLVLNGAGTGSPRPAAVTTFPSGLAAGGSRVTNVGRPQQPADAATKSYVDSVVPPPSQFTFNADGGFVARAAQVGQVPATGAGKRLMWDPASASLRAGVVSGNRWDVPGLFSVAFGYDTRAENFASMAVGQDTRAAGPSSVAAGQGAVATGEAAMALGFGAQAAGPAAIALGRSIAACGNASIALGAYASSSSAPTTGASCGGSVHDGAFAFSGLSNTGGGETWFGTVAASEFAVRAQGGVRLRTNQTASTGCNLAAGSGVWTCTSDRNQKQDFETVDGDEVLTKLAAMPIDRWSYKSEPGVRHIGPTAQDFRAAFGLGVDDISIGHVDLSGVSLRAIQALDVRTRDEVSRLREEIDALRALLAQHRDR